jgi:hypothetical protein
MSTVAGKRADLAVQKAKRQKRFVIVGLVLLVGVLVFQVPRLMKHLNSNTNVTDTNLIATPPTPAAGATVPVATVPGAAAASPTAPSTLPETDRVTVTPDSGQLVSFGLFKSKDPFVQQLTTTPADTTATPTPAAPATTPAATGTSPVAPAPTNPSPVSFPPQTTPSTTTPAPVVTPPPPTTPTTPTTPPGTVAIKIGGACQVVAARGTFPKGVDIFRVESIGKDGSIKISVNGGTYESGAATVTLKKGSKLTLMNTADGARYVLQLVSACPSMSAPGTGPAAPTTTTTPTTTTPTTTTPTTTTP